MVYVGPESPAGPLPGEGGKLLMLASLDSAHVQMSSGVVYLVGTEDLQVAASRVRDELDDSLDVPGILSFAVRDTFEDEGETGVLNTMASLGHLAGFGEIAEEALQHVSGRIRQDPSFREVLSHLDEEEGEALLRLASACLIRDAFGDEA